MAYRAPVSLLNFAGVRIHTIVIVFENRANIGSVFSLGSGVVGLRNMNERLC